MNKINKNESGFSAVELILVTAIVVLIGVVGWIVYKNYHKTTAATSTTKSATSTSPSITTTPTTNSATPDLIKIPQLGIEISVPASLEDLTYATGAENSFGSGTTGTGAWLSTKALAAADANCTASTGANANGGYTGGPLGVIAKINGTYPTNPTDSSGDLVLQESGYYIAYQPSQSACSTSQSVETIQTNDVEALKISNATVQLIK